MGQCSIEGILDNNSRGLKVSYNGFVELNNQSV